MSSWLRNIQGQLSDLANEVLNEANDVLAEAREEVADPNAELTVAKKNCAEAEKQLAIEAAKCESLEGEKKNLEQQLYDAHVEMDAIGTKLNGMVRQRDEEIKKLKNQMNQINESGWNDVPLSEDDQIADLKSQVAHWKSLVEQQKSSTQDDTIPVSELERRLEEQRQRKEHEIQALVESHAESMVDLREMYEEKIAAMQVMPYNASSSTSNADTLDAVLLEKEDLCETKKSNKSSNGSDIGERPVVVDLGSHDELVDERIRQIEAEKLEMQTRNDQIIEGLRMQNEEMMKAYDELNRQYEEFKATNTATESRNDDLSRRINHLKANLVEYEERYEMCKKESLQTVGQLEKLSQEFERLRAGVANVSQRREDSDVLIDQECEKLRNALDESRSERETLRGELQKFQVAVGEIDVELEKLRETNRKLLAENEALTINLSTYDKTMKDVITNSETDIGEFREQFREIQENHKQQKEAWLAENEALREEREAIKAQRDILMEESRLLKEVNLKLRERMDTEDDKNELLTKKIVLLESLVEENKKNYENEKKKCEIILETEIPKVGPPMGVDLTEEDKQVGVVCKQLKVALIANAEKTMECDEIAGKVSELEREVDLRQACIDEMIAQTNSLQMQHDSLSVQNSTLTNRNLAHERTIVGLEEKLKEEDEKREALEAEVKRLEDVIIGERESTSEDVPNDPESSQSDSATLRRFIAVLQSKLSEVEAELSVVKALKTTEDQEAAEVRRGLERDLREAEEVDRGLLEGIEKRVVEMEEQLITKVEQLEEAQIETNTKEQELVTLRERLAELEKERTKVDVLTEANEIMKEKIERLEREAAEAKSEMGYEEREKEELRIMLERAKIEDISERDFHALQNESAELREQLGAARQLMENYRALTVESQKLQDTIIELKTEREALMEEKTQFLQERQQMEEQISKLSESSEGKHGEAEEIRAQLSQAQQENEYLKTVAQTHHDENVKYYEQCQAMAAENQSMQATLQQMNSKIQELDGKLSGSADEHEKRAKELQRLREHLMIVEENSTREAVESEQRETELRARVRELEARGHAVEEGATESTQQYQVQIASLTSKLESIERSSAEWKGKYENEVKAREQTQEALSSLQNVVRELSVDHERDAATASHRNLELQTQIGTLQEEIGQVREELDRQSISRQAAEEETDRRQLQLDSKQKIIEDLENQIEDLRSPAKKSQDSYRIDDSTLRQLFLNYFNAEPAKRADIAMLLASILEYPPDEMDKFRSAVRQSQNGGGASSFFFGGASRGSPSGGSSITEQFIRFLEVESESSRTAPHLPMRNQSEPPGPQISLDSPSPKPSTSSQPNQASASSSAAALDSLLR